MKPDAGTASLDLPATLLTQIEAAAEEEHRAAADIVQDAVQRYVREKRWQRTLAYGAERARTLGLTEEDVPRLIAEVRAERRRERGE